MREEQRNLIHRMAAHDPAAGHEFFGIWGPHVTRRVAQNAVREKVRVANALAKLPKMDERFSKGELSYSKVRATTRIADETNEDYLLMIAKHGRVGFVSVSGVISIPLH